MGEQYLSVSPILNPLGIRGGLPSMAASRAAFQSGTKVLLVDQWVETGGTMSGAIQPVKRQKGRIAGLVALVFEDNEQTRDYRTQYKCVSAILTDTAWQGQADNQYLESFKTYDPALDFPQLRVGPT